MHLDESVLFFLGGSNTFALILPGCGRSLELLISQSVSCKPLKRGADFIVALLFSCLFGFFLKLTSQAAPTALKQGQKKGEREKTTKQRGLRETNRKEKKEAEMVGIHARNHSRGSLWC